MFIVDDGRRRLDTYAGKEISQCFKRKVVNLWGGGKQK